MENKLLSLLPGLFPGKHSPVMSGGGEGGGGGGEGSEEGGDCSATH